MTGDSIMQPLQSIEATLGHLNLVDVYQDIWPIEFW